MNGGQYNGGAVLGLNFACDEPRKQIKWIQYVRAYDQRNSLCSEFLLNK